ncbi:MAG: 30S ribosomal protein S6 [Phycisphaeraceae bacterium]|nr:30S ribosomal protein S6 [Phycisphaeraceae bacterium]
MSITRTFTYEGMFLLSQAVAANLGDAVAHIRQIIEKAGGSIIAMRKWDERRLAFEIDKQKRAVYILVYFNAPAPRLQEIERSCNLSEQVLRNLVIRADHLTEDEMKAADGQKELEIEAKLRASGAAPAPVAAAAVAAPSAEAEDFDEAK